MSMYQKIMSKYFLLVLALSVNLSAGELSHAGLKLKYTVERVPEWTELFRRTSGWSGADGIFSFFDKQSKKILFVFSDTWLGDVDPVSRKRKSMKMINNSMATLPGISPEPSKIQFIWNKNTDSSVFIPEKKKSWYWLQDGFIYKGHFYNFPMQIVKNPAGSEGFQFRTDSVHILKVPLLDGVPQISKQRIILADLFTKQKGHELFYGAGVLKNADDGFIYVYGRLHKDFQVKLVVAKIKPEQIEDITAWTYWDGKSWSAKINDSASLGEGGPELSVTRIERGLLKDKYILVSMPISREVFIRIGDSPVGPFGPKQVIYKTSEPDQIPETYTYNAKAHPVLSKENELIISYNVNTPKLGHHKNAEIYRPRFIKLKFHD